MSVGAGGGATLPDRFHDNGPWWVALLAALASLPGLWLPFLSDDWAQIDAAESAPIGAPFGDFRPLFRATIWLDRRLWGLSPSLFHLTNLVWIAAAAALVVILVRRYTGDARLALAGGALFAIHPYHVENAAWMVARSDPVYAVPFLLAALLYDRWRAQKSGLPVLALVAFEASLLGKETAVSLPLFLLILGAVDPRRRPDRREWLRGLVPLALVAFAHFAILRTWAIGGLGRTLGQSFGIPWIKNGLALAAASIVPARAEILVSRPLLFGGLATFVVLDLLILAASSPLGIPPAARAAPFAFVALVAPHLVGFQERYLFLAAAAPSVFVVSLVRTARPRTMRVLAVLLAAFWTWGSIEQWRGWFDAAEASRRLVRDLTAESRDGRVREILIANSPFTIHGASVTGDWSAALRLSGERAVPVRSLTDVALPSAWSDALDGPAAESIRRRDACFEVRLRVVKRPFSYLVWPPPGFGEIAVEKGATVTAGEDGRARVRICPADTDGRVACAWVGGRLVRLFGPEGL